MRLIDADALMEIYMDRLSLVADRYSPDSSECGILTGAVKLLDAQQTIEPEHKTGEWIDGKRMKFDGTFYWFRQCDQCGYERNDCDTEKDSNFCPDCGADMRRAKHERLD